MCDAPDEAAGAQRSVYRNLKDARRLHYVHAKSRRLQPQIAHGEQWDSEDEVDSLGARVGSWVEGDEKRD